MADKAHRLTDEKLEEMEKRLSAIYSRAEKEIQKTADEYFSKFAKLDEAKRKLVEQGKLTDDEYKKWRKGKMMYGKRFTEMKEQCAKQLLNVNQTALYYVNGELPEVYAINYNALAGSVDGVGGYSFTLVDADTVRNLAVTDTSLLPYKELDPAKDIPWNMKKINAETLQGILQGESMDKIAKRLRSVQEMNRTQAIRSARTIVTGAENKGRQDSYARAEADGIILQKEWLATNDGRTRHSHAALDGAIVDQDKKFENGLMYPGDPSGRPEEVYNCFVGETKVASDSDVVRSYKHKYNGKIISIKTAGGVQFTCTPNHPILTPNGWVAAELLNNGDNILVTFGENNVFSRVNPNINHRFPRIDTIHKFGKKLRSKRTSCLGVDFHGDVSTSNVEIVTHKRLLRNVRNTSGRNGIDKFLLEFSDKTLSCFGSLFKHFRRVCKTSFGFVSRKCKSLPFFKCSVSHSCEHGFGTISNRDGVLTEYSINDLPADTVIDGELLDRLSCKVFLDTIVNVDVSVLSTHVYNLQTENGYYFVNSIIPQDTEKSNGIFAIAKNCRCTLVAKVNGFKKVQVQKAMAEKRVEEPKITTREQAYKTLTDDIGFGSVSDNVSVIDEKLLTENVTQLKKLNDRFGALTVDNNGYFTATSAPRAVAYSQGNFRNLNNQSMSLCGNSYGRGYDFLVSKEKDFVYTNWSMPCLDKNFPIYTVTHEYGHIFENKVIRGRVDMDVFEQAYKAKMLEKNGAKKAMDFLKKEEAKHAKTIWQEITQIAKEENPDFLVSKNISEYGKTNYFEAFAETFANSQCGSPNELGKAMNIWLERNGY